MEGEQESRPQQNSSLECEECKSNPWKYKCPGCSIRTCSLPCVNSHKQRTACNGKKSLTHVLPLSQFDDNLLLSDYNMLEDVKRFAESSRRMRQRLCGYAHFKLPLPLKNLRRAATRRRTKIQFLSSGMSKREKNQTYYNNRNKFISWTIEWRFNSTDVVLIDHGYNCFRCRVREDTSLFSVLETHLKPGPWNHPLKQFCEESLDCLKLFIRKHPKGSKSPFYQLNIKAPLREQLANKVILEYPVIYVFLPSHSYDFEVIKYSIPRKVEPKAPDCSDRPSPRGVTFKEEDIGDGGSTDPRISDLLNCAGLSLASQTSNKPLDTLSFVKGTTSFFNRHFSEADQDVVGDTCITFDSEVLLTKEKDLSGEMDWSLLGDVLPVEGELEEGEIAPV
ncbi:box C/D snoRNA protein 1 [Capsicum chacoense]